MGCAVNLKGDFDFAAGGFGAVHAAVAGEFCVSDEAGFFGGGYGDREAQGVVGAGRIGGDFA